MERHKTGFDAEPDHRSEENPEQVSAVYFPGERHELHHGLQDGFVGTGEAVMDATGAERGFQPGLRAAVHLRLGKQLGSNWDSVRSCPLQQFRPVEPELLIEAISLPRAIQR
ncbi:MAG: hypothetical protein ACUVRY_06440 [Thermoanaerobaculaceae bacterium]